VSARPSYWEIVVAYIEEGYRAWQERDVASSQAVEDRLGLSWMEGQDWHRVLVEQDLIVMIPDIGDASTPYRLAPRGLAFAERLPDMQRLLAQQTAAVNASSSGEDEKRRARFSLRDEIYKTAVNKGADVVIQNAPTIWNTVRSLYDWLPQTWRSL
jgi:hypothetical protein